MKYEQMACMVKQSNVILSKLPWREKINVDRIVININIRGEIIKKTIT